MLTSYFEKHLHAFSFANAYIQNSWFPICAHNCAPCLTCRHVWSSQARHPSPVETLRAHRQCRSSYKAQQFQLFLLNTLLEYCQPYTPAQNFPLGSRTPGLSRYQREIKFIIFHKSILTTRQVGLRHSSRTKRHVYQTVLMNI